MSAKMQPTTLEGLLIGLQRKVQQIDRRLTRLSGGGSQGSAIQPGMVTFWTPTGAIPAGFLLADGSAVSRSTYSELFAAIGTVYGAGDGSTTFNLPNLKGRVPVGQDAAQAEFDVIGETGGAKTHTLTTAQIPAHQHYLGRDGGNLAYAEAGGPVLYTAGYGATRVNGDLITGQAGGGQAHNNLQPYLVGRWIIAFASGSAPAVQMLTNQGTTAQRDAQFGSPATDTQRVALANQRISWFNTDLGWEESYYAVTGLSGLTATGLVAGTASGWYPIGLGPSVSLLPSAAQSVTAGNTFVNWTAPGSGASWRRGGAAWIDYASGIITAKVAGRYRLSALLSIQSGSGAGALYVIKNGSASGDNILMQDSVVLNASLGMMFKMRSDSIFLAANDNVRVYTASMGGATVAVGANGTQRSAGEFVVEYLGPALVSQ